jgi:hypothetical protein
MPEPNSTVLMWLQQALQGLRRQIQVRFKAAALSKSGSPLASPVNETTGQTLMAAWPAHKIINRIDRDSIDYLQWD